MVKGIRARMVKRVDLRWSMHLVIASGLTPTERGPKGGLDAGYLYCTDKGIKPSILCSRKVPCDFMRSQLIYYQYVISVRFTFRPMPEP